MIAAGQSIGNYRILNKIGTGGMGAVYLAEHPLIGKRVALKVIHRELAGNREVVSRFFQEARAVNKIGNEHIVEIHDFGVTPEGDHFYIMEYLEGRTLAALLARERTLDVMRALHVGAQIASALSAAHAAGIIHRDLKPDNIMLMARLGEQDFVKVLDFGLAKVFSAATAVKTAAGVLLGTPQYMSPEACESKRDIDHRTDIYALGVLLFQMMTGALPFDGESMGEVLVKQVTMLPPAPRAMNPAIPPSVEQILLRCLAKPVDARFATMLQLREALLDPEAYLRGSPPIAPARSVTSAFAIGEASTMALQVGPPGPPPQQAPPMMPAAMQKTRLVAGPLPLPAPVPSISGAAQAPTMIGDHAPIRRASAGMPALAAPQEPKMNTMRIATPMGYSSRPPRKVWPVVLGMAVILGVGGGILSVTCFGHDSAGRAGEAEAHPAGAGSAGEPHVAAPGSASAAGSASSASSSDDATAVVMPPRPPARPPTFTEPPAGSGSSAGRAGAAGDAGTVGTTAAAGATAAGATAAGGTKSSAPPANPTSASPAAPTGGVPAAAAVPTAHLTIESVPTGAAVKGPHGAALGKTPLVIEWPTSDAPVAFELRLAGYKAKQKQTVINGNTRLVIELEKAPVRHTGASKPSSTGNGLMRPDE